jgi:hypothetical protein
MRGEEGGGEEVEEIALTCHQIHEHSGGGRGARRERRTRRRGREEGEMRQEGEEAEGERKIKTYLSPNS